MTNYERRIIKEQKVIELEKQLKKIDEQKEAKKEEIQALERQLKEIEKQRKEIANKIHVLKIGINQHKKHENRPINTNSEVYKMFGKRLRELTKEEYKIYYNARQKINRQKRKENNI